MTNEELKAAFESWFSSHDFKSASTREWIFEAAEWGFRLAHKDQEPVATKLETQQFNCFHVSFEDSERLKALPVGTKLYVSPQPAIPEGWQPIETAPKNHFRILVYGPFGALVAFQDINWTWYPFPPAAGELDYVPTHWMPLPAAPTLEPKP